MFGFIQDLSESKLIPSRTSLKHWDAKTLAELAFLYLLGLRVLLADDHEAKWAREYCKRAGESRDFSEWRTNGNDLYAMLYALSADPDDTDADSDKHFLDRLHIAPATIRNWLRHVGEHEAKDDTHPLFTRLDSMFRITDSKMRAMRRVVANWRGASDRERRDAITKLIQLIHDRAPSNSELLGRLKKLNESASGGSTSAASVATVVGGLGAGFDPSQKWRSIYGNNDVKPVVIRRGKTPKKV